MTLNKRIGEPDLSKITYNLYQIFDKNKELIYSMFNQDVFNNYLELYGRTLYADGYVLISCAKTGVHIEVSMDCLTQITKTVKLRFPGLDI